MESSNEKVIVVVEDEEDARILLAKKLRQLGYIVYEAANGVAGFKCIEQYRPDLVLSDVLMSPMNGGELLRAVRQAEWGNTIRFMVITARTNMRDYFEAEQVDGFIAKPISPHDLITQVKTVMTRPPRAPVKEAEKIPPQPIAPQTSAPEPETTLVVAGNADLPQKKNFIFSNISIFFLYGASVLIFIVIFVLNSLRGK